VVLLKIQVFWNVMLCIGREFSMFQRIVVPFFIFSGKQSGSLGLLGPEGKDTTVLCNTRNTRPNDTMSHPRRHESSLPLFLVWFVLYFIDPISVAFVYHLPSKHRGEVEIQLYPCSTLVLQEGGWSAPQPSCLALGKRPGTHCIS